MSPFVAQRSQVSQQHRDSTHGHTEQDDTSIVPQFINVTNSSSLDAKARTQIRAQVMRDYHRRRQQKGLSHGRKPETQQTIGQDSLTRRFKLGPDHGLHVWTPRRRRKDAEKNSVHGKASGEVFELVNRAKPIAHGLQYTRATEPSDQYENYSRWRAVFPGEAMLRGSQRLNEPSGNRTWQEMRLLGMSFSPLKYSSPLYQSPISGLQEPFSAISLPLTPRTQVLLHYYFNVRLQPSWLMMPVRKRMLSLALDDPALFHTFLSTYSAAYNSHFRGGDPEESMYHRTRAITLVNGRLGDAKPVLSDGTVIAVANLAVYESSNGSIQSMLIHWHGLEKMVDMRGGLVNGGFQLCAKRVIAWTDLHCAGALGYEPKFLPLGLPMTHQPEMTGWDSERPSGTQYIHRHEDNLDLLFNDMRLMAATMQRLRRCVILPKEDFWYSDKIYSMQHSLCSVAYGARGHNYLDVACGIAGLMFCTHCLRDIPLSYQVIAIGVTRLKNVLGLLEQTEDYRRNCGPSNMLLWVLAFGGVASESKAEREWFVMKFGDFCAYLSLRDWESVKASLETTLWQSTLDEAGSRLWGEAIAVTIGLWTLEM